MPATWGRNGLNRQPASGGKHTGMNLHEKYGLRRVINGYDKATHLGGARVLPEIAEVVSASLGHCFHLNELQRAAGRAIAKATGAEWGGVTACAAAGITLGVAAAMTGTDMGRIAQLPDTSGMPHRAILQKGHAISFGAPVTQMVRLSGAEVVEAGTANGCRPWHIEHELAKGDAAAIVAVESYHTSMYGGVPIPELAEIARSAGVPLIVDAATQELRLRELVASGPDLIVCSAHKYLGATTAGVVAGRRDLVEALLLQSSGIGRGMKVGKEGILGVLAAFEAPMWREREGWSARENEKAQRIADALANLPGVTVSLDPDPNGCPFLRVRVALEEGCRHKPDSLKSALAEGDPSVVVRSYPFDRDSIYINATEMTDEDIALLCERVRSALTA